MELEDIVFAISLDSIGNGDELFMHVSKPPRENQQAFEFLNVIKKKLLNIIKNLFCFLFIEIRKNIT